VLSVPPPRRRRGLLAQAELSTPSEAARTLLETPADELEAELLEVIRAPREAANQEGDPADKIGAEGAGLVITERGQGIVSERVRGGNGAGYSLLRRA
jgi:hypothetical protein